MVIQKRCKKEVKELVKLSQRVSLRKASEATGVSRSSIALWKKRYLAAKGSVDSPEYQKLFEGKQNPSRGD